MIPNHRAVGSRILLSTFLIILCWASPSFAEDPWAGQPYFSISAMVAAADGANIHSANRTNDPNLVPDANFKTKTGFGVAGALGWLLDTNWRLEMELAHRDFDLDEIQGVTSVNMRGDLTITTGMINIVKDFRGKSWITPYLGLGAGLGYHKLDVGQIGTASPDFGIREAFTLVYQGLAGVNLEVARNMDIVIGYRYLGAYQPSFEAFILDRLDIHHFEMGLKFYFEDWMK